MDKGSTWRARSTIKIMEIAVINTLQSQFDKRQGKFSKTYLKTRQKALDYVIAHDFPGRKDEDYKYTPIDRILK